MNTVRLRYEKGHLIPLEPLPDLQEGEEIVMSWEPIEPSAEEVQAMLIRTQGLWADWDGIEELIDDSRKKWDQAWQDKFPTS